MTEKHTPIPAAPSHPEAVQDAPASEDAFAQHQRDRIAAAHRFDAEQRMCLTCAANHYCPKHNPDPRAALSGVAAPAGAAPEFDRDDDGELLIDWSPSEDRMLILSLRSDGRLSYAFRWDGEKAHGTAQMPPAGAALTEKLWCVNVHGPDDVYPMPSKAAALERANEMNVYFGTLPHDEFSPIMRAVVIEWPHSAESHAHGIASPSTATGCSEGGYAVACQPCHDRWERWNDNGMARLYKPAHGGYPAVAAGVEGRKP